MRNRDLAIKIVSDGLAIGTTVYVDGEPIANVTAVTWSLGLGEIATATLTFEGVEIHVVPRAEP